ncbi:MAG: DNA polymerase III subunit chi [Proteobacteria bacterium]|nr:DNA polymerase III subunit chi [Pseudomonadota bacterium]
MAEAPTEVFFYHLERHPLERVLPGLLERTLERGWRAIVQAGTRERLDALDTHLWTFRDDSFLPHGTSRDAHPEAQPVLLTLEEHNPNAAAVRFLVDGATLGKFQGYLRVVVIFDGADASAVQAARTQWKSARAEGCATTYWQQTEAGRWEKKA